MRRLRVNDLVLISLVDTWSLYLQPYTRRPSCSRTRCIISLQILTTLIDFAKRHNVSQVSWDGRTLHCNRCTLWIASSVKPVDTPDLVSVRRTIPSPANTNVSVTDGLQRKAIKSFTFSDGTFIPEGTILNVTSSANHDPKFYHDPATFNPWRFCDDISERQSSSYVTSNYWLWGRGRHACPGRFFGTLEIKAILAQILLTYDIKTVDGRRPTDLNFVYLRLPNPRAKLLLRQREQEK